MPKYKLPFYCYGAWWCYRPDALDHPPLGPFFTEGYADEAAKRAVERKLPKPPKLSGIWPSLQRRMSDAETL